LYGTATVGTKGQVVIPVEAREALNIQPGDKLFVVGIRSKESIGLIKEDKLREIIDHLTDHVETYKDFIDKQ
jgi:AbrB family looped-hinge helix DNA binding protein